MARCALLGLLFVRAPADDDQLKLRNGLPNHLSGLNQKWDRLDLVQHAHEDSHGHRGADAQFGTKGCLCVQAKVFHADLNSSGIDGVLHRGNLLWRHAMLLQVARCALRVGKPPTDPIQRSLFVQFREARPTCLKVFSQAPEGGSLQSYERQGEKDMIQKKSVGLVNDNKVGCSELAECRLKEQPPVPDPISSDFYAVLARQLAIVALPRFRRRGSAIHDSELHAFLTKRSVQALVERSAVSFDLRFDNQNSFYQFVRFLAELLPVRMFQRSNRFYERENFLSRANIRNLHAISFEQ